MVRSGKGYDVLMDAAARSVPLVPGLHFLMVGGPTGDGSYFEEMVRLRDRLGLAGRVHFTGWRKDVADLMGAMDIFVLASTGTEGQSRVIPEAFALGRPVIASNFGGIPEIVRHGENGLLVPPGQPQALADAILQLAGDPACRMRLGAAGREMAMQELDFDRRICQSLEIYRRLLHTL
jgi:glycosyltransferase involved in cell wall biosynthesis